MGWLRQNVRVSRKILVDTVGQFFDGMSQGLIFGCDPVGVESNARRLRMTERGGPGS
jgi:hypothetical protein